MPKVRILLVDDHPLLREGLHELLSTEMDFLVCGEADSIATAVQALETTQPDVIVIDLTLGSDDGVELVKLVASRWPAVRILVLSMHEEGLYAERLLQLGAHGYLMKQESATALLAALRKVAHREIYVSPSISRRLLGKVALHREQSPAKGGLTDREHQVLRAVAQGLGTQEMSVALGMSAKTVDSHRRNIREKLGLSSATDLVRYAVRWANDNALPDSPDLKE